MNYPLQRFEVIFVLVGDHNDHIFLLTPAHPSTDKSSPAKCFVTDSHHQISSEINSLLRLISLTSRCKYLV